MRDARVRSHHAENTYASDGPVAIPQEGPKPIDIDDATIQNGLINIATRELATILRVAPTFRLDLKD